MATLSSPSSSPPPTQSRRKLRTCARRCERGCCTVATYFPLAFVYGLTTWAVWVEGNIGFGHTATKELPRPVKGSSLLGIFLYVLLNACYTVAVFTDPGSPLKSADSKRQGKYSILPTSEPRNEVGDFQNITVSSRGGARFCKKCHTPKPDRAHHCSTCKRCVLKMDHHCPWLATCLGLHNYKAFVLFLVYTCLFCWVCLGSSGWWMYTQLIAGNEYIEEFAPVNIILLSVVSGIIGLVLTGFTSWHLYLCVRGQTTIECLEKTRYLSGVRSRVERNRQEQHHIRNNSEGVAGTLQRAGEQILEFHANAVPGASRYEEGEERPSPAPSVHTTNPLDHSLSSRPNETDNDTPALRSLRRTYSAVESQRERERYEEYLDDKDTDKLPNAFDLGWKRNLSHLFGPHPLLWGLPVCNTTGDGWRWEVSQKWMKANEEVARLKEERLRSAANGAVGTDTRSVGIRGGGEATYERDLDADYGVDSSRDYSHSAMSMQTFTHEVDPNPNPHNNAHTRTRTQQPKSKVGRGARQRREFNQAEEGGEVDSFEVSGSEEGEDDDIDEYDDDIEGQGHDRRRGRGRRKAAAWDGLERRWS